MVGARERRAARRLLAAGATGLGVAVAPPRPCGVSAAGRGTAYFSADGSADGIPLAAALLKPREALAAARPKKLVRAAGPHRRVYPSRGKRDKARKGPR
jgi:hypothetical protein